MVSVIDATHLEVSGLSLVCAFLKYVILSISKSYFCLFLIHSCYPETRISTMNIDPSKPHKTLRIEGMRAISMLTPSAIHMLKDKSIYMKAYEITFFSIKYSYVQKNSLNRKR